MSKKFLYVGVDGLDTEANSYESSDFTNVGGAGNENAPVLLDASGLIDSSMINVGAIDHGGLAGLGDDDHTIYILADGTRAFSGNIDAGGNLLVNLSDGIADTDAATIAQLKAAFNNLDRKNSVRFGTSAALPSHTGSGTSVLTLTGLSAWSPDGTAVVDGDRVLVKDEASAHLDHGIYVVSGVGSEIVLTRSEDANSNDEVTSGLMTTIEEGSVNAGRIYLLTTADPIVLNTTALQFTNLSHQVYTASLGVKLVGSDFQADIVSGGGLELSSNSLQIEFSTAFNDALPVKASDLASNVNGFGASIIGIEDAGGYTSETDAEGAIQELYGLIAANGVEYTVGTGGVVKGDLVYISGNNEVLPYSNLSLSHRGIGLALTTEAAAANVKVLANDTIVSGLLTGATAGTPYYWDGSALSSTIPSTSGSYVWQVGVAKNATDLHVEVRFIKKNA